MLKKEDDLYLQEEGFIDDFILWPLIMACSIVCNRPNAQFKQEYIIPQMLYQLCVENTDYWGIRYHSTKLTNHSRKTMQSVMINYAFPAQDMKRFGYCPTLGSKFSLTKPITANMCDDIPIVPKARYFTDAGLPLLSVRSDELNKDGTILTFDRMTMYFNRIIMGKDFEELRPLYGWKRE